MLGAVTTKEVKQGFGTAMSGVGLENLFLSQYPQCHQSRKVRCEGNFNTECGNKKYMQNLLEKTSTSETGNIVGGALHHKL